MCYYTWSLSRSKIDFQCRNNIFIVNRILQGVYTRQKVTKSQQQQLSIMIYYVNFEADFISNKFHFIIRQMKTILKSKQLNKKLNKRNVVMFITKSCIYIQFYLFSKTHFIFILLNRKQPGVIKLSTFRTRSQISHHGNITKKS